MNLGPGSKTNPWFCINTAIPNDWITASTIVTYLDHCVILSRSFPPSFCISSILGKITPNNWNTMEALIYGTIPKAKIEALSTAPPENKFKNWAIAFPCWKFLKASVLIPGTAIWIPTLATIIISNVNVTLFSSSGILKIAFTLLVTASARVNSITPLVYEEKARY